VRKIELSDFYSGPNKNPVHFSDFIRKVIQGVRIFRYLRTVLMNPDQLQCSNCRSFNIDLFQQEVDGIFGTKAIVDFSQREKSHSFCKAKRRITFLKCNSCKCVQLYERS
jgi:hypothetical protein